MRKAGYRRPLSVAALGLLAELERHGGAVVVASELVRTPRDWQVLATLLGRYFVRVDTGGRNLRITRHGREYLRGRRVSG